VAQQTKPQTFVHVFAKLPISILGCTNRAFSARILCQFTRSTRTCSELRTAALCAALRRSLWL